LEIIYDVSGISRQSHSNYQKRRKEDQDDELMVINSIIAVRELHPCMGLRKIYELLLPENVGRDNFIDIGVENGFCLPKPKNYQRTTYSSKFRKYKNLTIGLRINGINTVWVSDITYIYINGRFYYITFVVDVYSRRILGFEASETLQAESSCRALKMALQERRGLSLQGLIHHSDRGSQYISNEYTGILNKHGIGISMCDSVYENTHIERVNGIIKNEYLLSYKMDSLKDLRKMTKQAVDLYNNMRPHWSLFKMNPVIYEESLLQIPMNKREVMYIWSEGELKNDTIYNQEELFENYL